MMPDALARSFFFGVTMAAAVGPIALLIVSYGVRDGFKPAAAAGLGAALADLAYAGIAFALGSLLLSGLARHEAAVKAGSALTLVLFGAGLAGRALRASPAAAPSVQPTRVTAPLVTTFALTIVNPLTIVLFAAFSAQLPAATSGRAIGAAAFALFLGSLAVQLVWAAGGSVVARLLSHVGGLRVLNVASGAAIAAFGVAGIVELALV
jgi:threonine/homoserine/homoserine lactone efflux protein